MGAGGRGGRKEGALHGDKINGTAVSRVQYSVFPILRKTLDDILTMLLEDYSLMSSSFF